MGLTTGLDEMPTSAYWISRAVADNAGIVRVAVPWAGVAPAQRPPGFVAGDPASPGYDWSTVDAQVRAFAGRGLRVLINITGAPTWAQGPRRPSNAAAGSWRPDPKQFAQFAKAAALRYDGAYRDPSDPLIALPRVRYWQAWNEPNLDQYLTPQWTRKRDGGFMAASAGIYRRLLNAFYAAVKGVSGSDFVLSAGMAPYGNPPGISLPGFGSRVPPVVFDRALLSARVHLNGVAQNIYSIRGPLWHAYNVGDVAVPDVYKIRRVLRFAQRAGRVLPRGPKRLWVTELGWDSRPPNPGGVPIAKQARWYEQAMYGLWRQGVDTVMLLALVDSPSPIPPAGTAAESGLYYASGTAKPAATAFRFPFVTERLDRGQVRVWGRAPVGGQLVVERRSRGRWRVIARLNTRARQLFGAALALRGSAVLRGRVDGQTSLSWRQRA